MSARVALVTGCSTGIGLDAALQLARSGFRTVASMRDLGRAGALESASAGEGLGVEILELDVTDDASVATAADEVLRRHGGIDVLVNNAGIAGGGAVENLDLDHARRLMETNFWGPVRMVRAVLPSMRTRGSGVIINVTSLAARLPGGAFNGIYAASKHAMSALSEALSSEVERFGIRVVCIEPGFFATNISANATSDPCLSGPYAEHHRWARDFVTRSVSEADEPVDVVSNAIVAAANDPASPLHVLVGTSAPTMVGTFEALGSFEAWKPVIQQIYERLVGPKPV